MASRKALDLETSLKDIRRQMSEQLASLDFRVESKLSLLSEYQEFFKRRGEVEYEYARNLERICEKFEKNTKQRNIRNEVRSTFNFWSTLLAETRKISRERAALAEVMASEMTSRLDIMSKDVQMMAKKCRDMCAEIQDQFIKELRDISEQTKVYQHACHNTAEAYNKLLKSKDKVDASRGGARKKKAQDKQKERQKQFNVQRHQLMRNRNDLLLGIVRCNSLATQYYNMDIMDVIEYMDFDYHESFRRLALAYRESEKETSEAILQSADQLVDHSKNLNFENDLHYFLSEYSQTFTQPNPYQFNNFEGDDVTVYKVNTEDVYKRAKKMVEDLQEEVQTLNIQIEEDVKTIQHMEQVNLKKYQVVTVDEALAVLEENGEQLPGESFRDRGNASLERGLSLSTKGAQALQYSQKGKRDTIVFTLGIVQRRIYRAERLALATAQLDVLEKAIDEQKVPPVPVGVDAQGRYVPGEVPKLFNGDIVQYIMATGCEIPLIVTSCCKAIEKEGIKMEGLFRVPGPAAYTEDLIKGFEEGRDPLAYMEGKVDVAGVASTLKAYFRELSTPLFPTAKYQQFINCTKAEDRLASVKETVHTLHPSIVKVMNYLFGFLQRVSLHAADSKMNSANLALVFGPTLTRAPDSVDPRQLHNDVPSVNVLIQLCIDHHDVIFGEENGDETTPPVEVDPCRGISPDMLDAMSTSPPSEPPSAPPSASHDTKATFESNLPTPPLPPRTDTELPANDEHEPPRRPPKPSSMSPPPVELVGEEIIPNESDQQKPETLISETETQPTQEEESVATSNGLTTELDETMQEIQNSIQDLTSSPEKPSDDSHAEVDVTKPEPADVSDDDTDSEDEEEEILKIDAQALHDYKARSDKELSFKKGDLIQVIEKTPDNNWWDGFIEGRRGFIPVAYIEILELRSDSLPPTPVQQTLPTMAVPAPPQRKSSKLTESVSTAAESATIEATVHEEIEEKPEVELTAADRKVSTPELKIDSSACEESHTASGQDTHSQEESALDVAKPEVVRGHRSGSVKSLTMQFSSPEHKKYSQNQAVSSPTAQASHSGQKILVEPPKSKRPHSEALKKPPESASDIPPRSASASTGSKVGMMTSAFESKAAAQPPPIKPKPVHIPSSQVSEQQHTTATVFPLMSHPQTSGGLPSVSPLQRAAHMSQVGGKPQPQAQAQLKKQGSGGKGSFKVTKRDKNVKSPDKPTKGPVPTKPPAPAKPSYIPPSAMGAGLYNKELKDEMQARLKKQQGDTN